MKKIRLIANKGGAADCAMDFDLRRLTANLRVQLSAIRRDLSAEVESYFQPDANGLSRFDDEVLPTLPYSVQATIKTYLTNGLFGDAVRLCAAEVERLLEDQKLQKIAELVVIMPHNVTVEWAEQEVGELRKLDEFFR